MSFAGIIILVPGCLWMTDSARRLLAEALTTEIHEAPAILIPAGNDVGNKHFGTDMVLY